MKNEAEYWRKRANINENVLDKIIQFVGDANPYLQESLYSLRDSWQEAFDEIDKEHNREGSDK